MNHLLILVKCSMKSQHNLFVVSLKCLVAPTDSEHLQGYRTPMAHQAQPLVPGTSNKKVRDLVFLSPSLMLCTQSIVITTAHELEPNQSALNPR